MLQQSLAAIFLVGIIVYCASPQGSLHLTRHVPHGARIRHAAFTAGGLLVLVNALSLAAAAPTAVRDTIAAVTLVAIAAWGAAVLRSLPAARRARATPSRILAIGAHPDDLELACGASLAKLADAGYEIHGLVMSAGQVGGDSSRRPQEAHAGGALMGLARIDVLDLPDTSLSAHSQTMVAAIEERMRLLDPVLMLTHSEHDLHQDHQAVHLATLRAGRRHPSILGYESPSVTRAFNPSVFVDVRDYLDIKIEAIKRHRDQLGKPYMSAATVRGTAAFRGGQARIDFAEAFEPVRLLTGTPGVSGLLAGGARPALQGAFPMPTPTGTDVSAHLPAPAAAAERSLVGAGTEAAPQHAAASGTTGPTA